MKIMKITSANHIRGIASVITLFPPVPRISYPSTAADDLDAIAADFIAVGRDISLAIQNERQKQEEEKQADRG